MPLKSPEVWGTSENVQIYILAWDMHVYEAVGGICDVVYTDSNMKRTSKTFPVFFLVRDKLLDSAFCKLWKIRVFHVGLGGWKCNYGFKAGEKYILFIMVWWAKGLMAKIFSL